MKILHDLRNDYLTSPIDENSLDKNPIKQFVKWFEGAEKVLKGDCNAFVLSTYSLIEKRIHSRVLLLKEVTSEGFVFFTNYESLKAQDMAEHPVVSMNFFWNDLHQQVRIEGNASKISQELSKKYFYSRPKESQIAAFLSPQSKVIESHAELMNKHQELSKKYGDLPVPFPENWGGYIIKPECIEFWQGRTHRLHDRIVYKKVMGGVRSVDGSQEDFIWSINRLAP